jgi:hypothetical protein
MIAQTLGAKLYDRAEEVMYSAMRMAVGIAAIIVVILEITAPWLSGLFIDDPAVIRVATLNLRIEIVAELFYASFLIYHSLMVGAGHPYWRLSARSSTASSSAWFWRFGTIPSGITGVFIACMISRQAHSDRCFTPAEGNGAPRLPNVHRPAREQGRAIPADRRENMAANNTKRTAQRPKLSLGESIWMAAGVFLLYFSAGIGALVLLGLAVRLWYRYRGKQRKSGQYGEIVVRPAVSALFEEAVYEPARGFSRETIRKLGLLHRARRYQSRHRIAGRWHGIAFEAAAVNAFQPGHFFSSTSLPRFLKGCLSPLAGRGKTKARPYFPSGYQKALPQNAEPADSGKGKQSGVPGLYPVSVSREDFAEQYAYTRGTRRARRSCVPIPSVTAFSVCGSGRCAGPSLFFCGQAVRRAGSGAAAAV